MNDQWLDSVYENYHAWKGWEPARNTEGEIARAVVELRMADVPAPARLLEMGYGDGTFLRRARALGYDCAGLERKGSAADLALLKSEGIDARTGTPEQFADRQFDLIAAFDVFEHIAIPDLIRSLQQLAGLLAINGRIVARFPNMASPFGLANQFGDITHITPLSPLSFAQLAMLAGLETVRVANGATVLTGDRGIRAILKPLSLATRKMIELVLSFAYYGKVTPLAPSVVVVLRKRA
jgi:2-polyprenyl-3-methyl-5-hydroxy-6-metoxy-1,4-benzoquinol methylase